MKTVFFFCLSSLGLILAQTLPSPKPNHTPFTTNCKLTKLGLEYAGPMNVTKSGIPCQRWDSQQPHNHGYTASHPFPEGNLSDAGNKCRNPSSHPEGVWCYTTDPKNAWEVCDVKFCDVGCKQTKVGLEYTGSQRVTKSGLMCQRWDSDVTNTNSYKVSGIYSDGNVSAAGNKCRNPNKSYGGVWCYTTDSSNTWEDCDLEFCAQTKERRPYFTPLTKDCKLTKLGLEYAGPMNVTKSGFTCQRWDSQQPHAHTYTDPNLYPEGNLSDAGNKCRNPSNEVDGVWCYTTDPKKHWENCDVNFCDLTATTHSSLGSENSTRVGCKLTKAGREYTGSLKVTRTGKPCQPWNSDRPHTNKFKDPKLYPDGSLASAGNKCRNPDKDYDEGVWCYTNDTRTEREPCDVDFCDVGCKPTKAGRDYTGPQSETASGRICQRWDSDDPHVNKFKDSKLYPDGNATAAGNKCRNPDKDYNEGVWCYTTNPDIERELCDVAYCSSP